MASYSCSRGGCGETGGVCEDTEGAIARCWRWLLVLRLRSWMMSSAWRQGVDRKRPHG